MGIVHFTPKDQEATVAFMKTIYKEMGWPETSHDGFDDLEKFFHINEDGFLLLIKDNGKVVGTAGCVHLTSRDILLKRFFIAPEIRGSGIAKTLLDTFLQEVKKFDASRIVIDVTKKNARAIRFYAKNGFMSYHQTPIERWPETERPDIFNYYYLNI